MNSLEKLTEIEIKDLEYLYKVAKEEIDKIIEEKGTFDPSDPIKLDIEPPKDQNGLSKSFIKEVSRFKYKDCVLRPSAINSTIIYIQKEEN